MSVDLTKENINTAVIWPLFEMIVEKGYDVEVASYEIGKRWCVTIYDKEEDPIICVSEFDKYECIMKALDNFLESLNKTKGE